MITPLQGVDDQVYAVAQGNLSIGVESNSPSVPYYRPQQTTAGRIPGGALVEKEVPVNFTGKGALTIVLDDPDFTTANRVVESVRRAGLDASAKDAGTVSIPVGSEDIVALVARVESLRIVPDTVAKIVINERTGTIVIGENVRIAPVAVSYSGIDVVIGNVALYSEGNTDSNTQDENRYRARSTARLVRKEGKLVAIPTSPTLSTLVRALNAIGASPKDLIAILQAIKSAGALNAELEII